MKIIGSNIFCCLVMMCLSVPVFSEESQVSVAAAETVNCEQKAIDMDLQGEELDNFVADCEHKNSGQSESGSEELDPEEMPVGTE